MIKIISGTYGYKSPSGIISPKTAKDEPFLLSIAEEDRLVSLGIAEYVDSQTAFSHNEYGVEVNSSMKRSELETIALRLGLDSSKARNRETLVELIQSAQATDDGKHEAPPTGTQSNADGKDQSPSNEAEGRNQTPPTGAEGDGEGENGAPQSQTSENETDEGEPVNLVFNAADGIVDGE